MNEVDIAIFSSEEYVDYYSHAFFEYNKDHFKTASTDNLNFKLFNVLKEFKEGVSVIILDIEFMDIIDCEQLVFPDVRYLIINNSIKNPKPYLNLFCPGNIIYQEKPVTQLEVIHLTKSLVSQYELSKESKHFLSNISHEMLTPLNSILGFANLLKSDFKLEELDIIIKQSKRLERLIRNMIYLNSNSNDINQKIFDSDNLYKKLKDRMNNYFEEEAISRIVIKNNFSGLIYGDVEKLIDVVMNLLGNSMTFSKDECSLQIYQEEENIIFKIIDTGIGISEAEKKYVFDKFYRVEDKHHDKLGLGIGLTVSNKIIKAHNGNIQIESELGKGSIFKVYIPVGN